MVLVAFLECQYVKEVVELVFELMRVVIMEQEVLHQDYCLLMMASFV